ncbi:hypothetical protein NL868_001293 [Shigella flexneri]|nr:hypothetical protein [Shigella flexneri]
MQNIFDEKLEQLESGIKYAIKEADYRGYDTKQVNEIVEEYYKLSTVNAFDTKYPNEHIKKIDRLIKKTHSLYNE